MRACDSLEVKTDKTDKDAGDLWNYVQANKSVALESVSPKAYLRMENPF